MVVAVARGVKRDFVHSQFLRQERLDARGAWFVCLYVWHVPSNDV